LVRLFVYSGRQDPEWTLESDELKELLDLLRRVADGEEIHPPPPGGLGYRGFVLENVPLRDRPLEITVFRGVVTERTGERTAHWHDTEGVERRLIDQARQRGHGAVLDAEGIGESSGD
jgi:hypothetical protein